MKRRIAIARALCGFVPAALSLPASAADGEPRRIGWMATQTRAVQQPFVDAFAARLEARGYRIGRDFVMVGRFGDNNLQTLPAVARELVALQPAVIVAVGSPCTAALARETRTVPIIMAYASTPVEIGLVASLARPGGNITGTTASQPEVAGKLLEVLRVASSSITRVAIFRNPDNLGIKTFSPYAEDTARRLGMVLHYIDLRRSEDLQLDQVDRFKPDALYVINDFVVVPLYRVLLQYALEHRLPTIGVGKFFAQSGGLLSLGPDLEEMDANVAEYVDRVLKGASPALMPVREPSRYEIVVNRKTAQAIGLPVSHELLLRTHEVIE